MKKKVIKILCIVLGIPLGLILLAVLFFVANDIYQQLPHHITDVEEIQYLIPYFEDMPIESCDCRWEADVIFMGGALETHSSGKITVSQEYYDSLLENYSWHESSGVPTAVIGSKNPKKELNEAYWDFMRNEKYLVSGSFQKQFDNYIDASYLFALAKDEPCIYYYYHSF